MSLVNGTLGSTSFMFCEVFFKKPKGLLTLFSSRISIWTQQLLGTWWWRHMEPVHLMRWSSHLADMEALRLACLSCLNHFSSAWRGAAVVLTWVSAVCYIWEPLVWNIHLCHVDEFIISVTFSNLSSHYNDSDVFFLLDFGQRTYFRPSLKRVGMLLQPS